MYNLPTQPLGIGKLLDSGFKLFFAGFKNILGLLGIQALLSIAVLGGLIMSILGIISSNTPDAQDVMLSTIGIFVIAYSVLSIVFYAGYIAKFNSTANGGSMGLGESLGTGFKKFFPIIFFSILYMLAVVIGSILLIIPGIILMISLSLGMYLIVTDNLGPIDALKQSHAYVWGNWWRTLLYISIAGIISMIIYFILLIPFGFIIGFLAQGDPMMLAMIDIMNQFLSFVITPFMVAMFLPLISDLRLRKQGGDLAARIGTATA